MKKKISVIIPVYNCEEFLRRAIESVIRQPDFESNELILVDDGSVDKSPEICDEYGCKFDNIRVIHQQNSGVSVARNNGINCAEGKWICFVDSDDYLLDGAFSAMLKYGEADIICAGHKSNENTASDYRTVFSGGFYKKCEISDQLDKILASSNSYFYTCWAKLFNRDIIIENDIYFPHDRKLAEDMVFVYSYLKCCETISIINEAVYHYFVNDANTTSVIPKSFETFLFIYNWKSEYFRNTECDKNKIEKWLQSSLLFKSFFSIKTAATYLDTKSATGYISEILNNETFYSIYINSDEYSSFKIKIDELLDSFIRKKKPLLIVLMFKIINLNTKLHQIFLRGKK